MAIPEFKKDSMDWQLIGGLDADGEAAGLTFEGERIVVDSGESYWKDRRYEYDTGDLIYRGVNTEPSASTSATTWHIYKYTWDVDDLVRLQGPLSGSWDGRAGLGW